MILTTAEDSYNIFKPNLDPVEEERNPEEETKHGEGIKASDYYIDSEDED